jgi:hypothetical protein
MRRLTYTLVCCTACCLGFLAEAVAQQIPTKYFVGKWEVTDSAARGVTITTIEMTKDGEYKGGVWSREWGGPNGIGATQYRVDKNELVFFYRKPGRPREDIMLSGAVNAIDNNEFEFKVTGGVYGQGKNIGFVFKMKRL